VLSVSPRKNKFWWKGQSNKVHTIIPGTLFLKANVVM
jgi:hypothetical protein